MRIITGFLFLLNVAFWVGFDAICWFFTGGTFGWTVLIGLIIFLIAWGISIEATIAPLDYFMQSEWGIFTKKSNGLIVPLSLEWVFSRLYVSSLICFR